jgi:uncharacterized protein YjiS (DUF1127 family)
MSEKVIKLHASRSRWTKLVDQYRVWNECRVAKAQLRAMPDHLLADIGIMRVDINSFVNGGKKRATAPIDVLNFNASQVSQPVAEVYKEAA